MDLKRCAIWGSGNDGILLFNTIKTFIDVVCFIDSYNSGRVIEGLRVITFDEFESEYFGENIKILVGTRKYQHEMVRELNSKAYRKGEDYLSCDTYGFHGLPFASLDYFAIRCFLGEKEALNLIENILNISKKKGAIIYGNCQTEALLSYLVRHKGFRNDYILIIVPTVCNIKSPKAFKVLEEGFWEYCDLLIEQKVSQGNKYNSKLATEIIESYLPHRAKRVIIPFVYFEGYHPQCITNNHNVHFKDGDYGLFPMGDKYVDLMEESGESKEEILRAISRTDYLSPQEIEDGCKESILELKRREIGCSIIMSDYLEENYKERQLFYSPKHPVPEIMLEESIRIMSFLGYEDHSFIDLEKVVVLKGVDVPCYPSVVKTLGLKEVIQDCWANSHMWDFCGNFLGYEKQYIETCWENKQTEVG